MALPAASKTDTSVFRSACSTYSALPACRNILKTNDVRTGLKKPEQGSSKRAASSEPAQLAEAVQAADLARADPAQAADRLTADRQPHNSTEAAATGAAADAVHGSGDAHAAPSEWDTAKAARDRCATTLCLFPPPFSYLQHKCNFAEFDTGVKLMLNAGLVIARLLLLSVSLELE